MLFAIFQQDFQILLSFDVWCSASVANPWLLHSYCSLCFLYICLLRLSWTRNFRVRGKDGGNAHVSPLVWCACLRHHNNEYVSKPVAGWSPLMLELQNFRVAISNALCLVNTLQTPISIGTYARNVLRTVIFIPLSIPKILVHAKSLCSKMLSI